MSNHPLRLGIVGAGSIGRVHASTFAELADAEVVAIADAVPAAAEAAASQLSIPIVHQTPDALIADSDLDAVVIGVPNQWHAPLAIAALAAGKHVLLEKPMGLDAAAARQIYQASKQAKTTLMIGHQMRWESVSLQIHEQLTKGAFGDIYYVRTGWLRRKGIPGWGSWFTRKDVAGGGALVDIGVHMLDLSQWLMGNPRPVSVAGATFAKLGETRQGIGTWGTPNWEGYFDVDDLGSALVRFDNGAVLSLEVSWAHHGVGSNGWVDLLGSKAGAAWRGREGTLLTEAFERTADVPLATPANDVGPRARLSRHFIDCCRTGATPWTSARSGLINNLILAAIYESSQQGREIELDTDGLE